MFVVSIISLIISSYMLIIGILNFIFFKIYDKKIDKDCYRDLPKISILIPARDEEKRIKPTLDTILNQDYKNYEVLVLNDNSSDKTEEILKQYQKKYSNLKYFNGKPLKENWKGKPFAIQQLIEKSTGEYIICLDADLKTKPDFIDWAITSMIKHKVDCFTGWARHYFGHWTECFITPGMYFQSTFLMPIFLIPKSKNKNFTIAAQFIVYKREALINIDGYAAIPGVINEDLGMMRVLKERGYKAIFLDAKNFIYGNMYDSYKSACDGIKRSISDVFNKKFYPILILSFFMLFAYIFPMIYTGFSIIHSITSFSMMMVSFLFITFCWILAMIDRKMPITTYFMYPIVVLHIIFLAWSSYYEGKTKGFIWKGRKVS